MRQEKVWGWRGSLIEAKRREERGDGMEGMRRDNWEAGYHLKCK